MNTRDRIAHYLQDERDDPDLCHDDQHHADVVAMWGALAGIPSNASLTGAARVHAQRPG